MLFPCIFHEFGEFATHIEKFRKHLLSWTGFRPMFFVRLWFTVITNFLIVTIFILGCIVVRSITAQ